LNSDLSELALNKLVASDEEEVALSLPVTEETAWEYGAELPEVEVTPEQLDSAEALYMRDIRRYNLLTAKKKSVSPRPEKSARRRPSAYAACPPTTTAGSSSSPSLAPAPPPGGA
jgi:hypothetical protein